MSDALRVLPSRFGRIGVVASESGISRCWLPSALAADARDASFAQGNLSVAQDALLTRAVTELEEFLSGRRREFSVPLDWKHASVGFAGEVQRALRQIPYGETESYGNLAARLQRPGAARAVGTACGKNPLPLFAPCHRVIRAGGEIGLYGGGEALKRALLELEAVATA